MTEQINHAKEARRMLADNIISRTEETRHWNLYVSALGLGSYEADGPMHENDEMVRAGVKRVVVTEVLGAADELEDLDTEALIEVQYQSGERPVTRVTQRFQEWIS